MDGLSYGGMSVPVRSYLEYDIKLLADLRTGRRGVARVSRHGQRGHDLQRSHPPGDHIDVRQRQHPPLGALAGKGRRAPTTLTIIANEININGPATIIYSFDGAPGPAYDPGTPKPPQTGTAANGGDGFSASGTGPFPQAANGSDGGPGMTGAKGIAGVDAPEIQIFVGLVKQMTSGKLTINVKGQDGGRGGNGGAAVRAVTARKALPRRRAPRGMTTASARRAQERGATAAREGTPDFRGGEAPEATAASSTSSPSRRRFL